MHYPTYGMKEKEEQPSIFDDLRTLFDKHMRTGKANAFPDTWPSSVFQDVNRWANTMVDRRAFQSDDLLLCMDVFAEAFQRVILSTRPVQDPITIYRGVKQNYIDTLMYTKHGKQYSFNPNFSSGSLLHSHAMQYVGVGCCLLVIKIPKGAHAIYLDTTTFYPREYEVVLPKDSNFEIIRDTSDDVTVKPREIHLRYIVPTRTSS